MPRIAICTVQVPFIRGGAEYLAESLKNELICRGYEAEIVSMPFKWYPPNQIIDNIMMWRTIDLTEVNGIPIDKVIALKFPAYYVKHTNKVIWLLHQHRQAYDLWGTEFGDLHNTIEGRRVRELIVQADDRYIKEAKKIFTISQNVTDRLSKFNNITAITLYHPPMNHDRFYSADFGDYIYYPSRIDRMKRQELLIKALLYTKTAVKIVLSGTGSNRYLQETNRLIEQKGLKDRVKLTGVIPEDEKIKLYAHSIGVYFGAYNEDYGYVPLEAFLSGKPVITHHDSGGALEFVNQENGFVVDATPEAIAEKMDYLFMNKGKARDMGQNGLQLMKKLNMNWDFVIEQLLK